MKRTNSPDTLQSVLFNTGDDDKSLRAAVARSNPSLAAKNKRDADEGSSRSELLARLILSKDDPYGERDRQRMTGVRLGSIIEARLLAFLAVHGKQVDKARVIEMALDELLGALGY